MKILIAGGGIGGLTAALNFARRGAEVHLFEKASSLTGLTETGAGIQLSPNAMYVLSSLGLDTALERVAVEPRAASLRHYRTGKPYVSLPLKNVYEKRYGAKYLHIHRADLIAVLCAAAERAGVRIHLGQAASSYEQTANEVVLKTKSGDRHQGDLLIGADGIGSTIRALMFPNKEHEKPRFTGQVAWRGLVDARAIPAGTIPFEANVWVGSGQHFVAYYLHGGEPRGSELRSSKLINFVAVEERADWAAESWSVRGKMEEVRAAFADSDEAIQTLLSACDECFLWGLFDHAPLARWRCGRVVLMGDACHAMLPFMAQGGAMAIEDGYVLAKHVMGGGGDGGLASALAAYEAARKPRTTMLQKISRSNARLYHASGVGGATRRRLLFSAGKRFPALLNARLDKIYAVNVVSGA